MRKQLADQENTKEDHSTMGKRKSLNGMYRDSKH